MKFDYCIGNPPYQKQTVETANRQEPVYNDFMDIAYSISDRVELITPARFLFDRGKTPKVWNKKMLKDPSFQVLRYEPDSKNVFSNEVIKGGVAIHYRDTEKNFGAIEKFIPYKELKTVVEKVEKLNEDKISSIVFGQSNFNLDGLYKKHKDFKSRINSDGRSKQIRSNAFKVFPEIFVDQKDKTNSLAMYGIQGQRTTKYINPNFVETSPNQAYYKVILPQVNGKGALGESLTNPVIGEKNMGYTQSFIGIGKFDTKEECENCLKYIKTKFFRALLGTLKVTHNNAAPEIWSNIPVQDFTNKNKLIDWSKSISEIDKDLYAKYKLTNSEIQFIEKNVKVMI